MLVKIIMLNDSIIVTKHWPGGKLPARAIEVLWSAMGCVGKNVAEQIIRDLYERPQFVEVPRKNFVSDKFVEFGKYFDFSIEDFDDDPDGITIYDPEGDHSAKLLKLYTVTVPVKFTGKKPIHKYTALVLASAEEIAEKQVLHALGFGPGDYVDAVQVLEIEEPFHDGDVLTLNSQ